VSPVLSTSLVAMETFKKLLYGKGKIIWAEYAAINLSQPIVIGDVFTVFRTYLQA
jgi:hypothetical protein